MLNPVSLFSLVVAGTGLAFCTCRPPADPALNPNRFRIMFYNTENLFDPENDSLKDDDDFTPQGTFHWTPGRLTEKLNNLYKVIVAVGEEKIPDVIGLCEVENRKVLEQLVRYTPLSKHLLEVIHEDSPDRRGIDVALIYNPKTAKYLQHRYHSAGKKGLVTRNILHVTLGMGKDTCHFFVNHWPSRSAGRLATDADRFAVATRVRLLADSLLQKSASCNIVIMGDLNDDPVDISLVQGLKALPFQSIIENRNLYNLSAAPTRGPVKGTLKYKGSWNLFDQIVVSGCLLQNKEGFYVQPEGYRIFDATFLLRPDESGTGFKPFRTYNGFKYLGGFSDHLPVYIDLLN